MPADREKAYLWDMLDAALAVDEFVRGKTYKDYLSNRMMRGAVERYVEIIGEAARRISESTRQAYHLFPVAFEPNRGLCFAGLKIDRFQLHSRHTQEAVFIEKLGRQ